MLDEASNSTLENEFGTHRDDDVVKQILEKGEVQESEVSTSILFLAFMWNLVLTLRCL